MPDVIDAPTPIVFSHGFGGSRADWSAVATSLADRTPTRTWDLPGHGDAPPATDGEYSRETALGSLGVVMDDVGGSAVLAGHSLGGYLSLVRCLRRPDTVHALVLVATGPGYRQPEGRAKWNEMVTRAEAGFDVAAGAAGLVRQHDSEVIDGLASIDVPTLLIVGERDHRFHAAHELLAGKLDATAVMVAGAGHHVQSTHADEVASLIGDFLYDRDMDRA